MTHDELIDRISAGAGVPKTTVREVLNRAAMAVREGLARGEEVTLPGLAKFEAVDKPARSGRNPATGESISIPAHRAVKIKALKALRDAVTS